MCILHLVLFCLEFDFFFKKYNMNVRCAWVVTWSELKEEKEYHKTALYENYFKNSPHLESENPGNSPVPN